MNCRKFGKALIALLLVLTVKAWTKGNEFMENELYIIPRDCDFSTVSNGASARNECSPKLKDRFFSDFLGVVINVPEKVIWNENDSVDDYPIGPWGETEGPFRLFLAGLIRVPYKVMELYQDIDEQVLVIAVNQDNAIAYSGKMPRANFESMPEENTPKRLRNQAELEALTDSYFNLDLIHDLGVPIADATYHVYATLGEYKSNVMTVKTSVKK